MTRDAHYEEFGSVSPSPRWHAARGLLRFARFPELVDTEAIQAILRLGEDPRADVRSEIARYLFLLHETVADVFWALLRRIESAETSHRIVHFALLGTRSVAKVNGEEMTSLARGVFARFRNDPAASDVRAGCLGIVMAAGAQKNHPYGDDLIRLVLGEPTIFVNETIYLVQAAAAMLAAGPVNPPDESLDLRRIASFELLERIARDTLKRMQALNLPIGDATPSELPPDRSTQIEAIHRVANELGTRLYFASGSFDDKRTSGKERPPSMDDSQRTRFLREAASLLGLLTEIGLRDVVHNVLEILANYVAIDPRWVFVAAVRAVRHGESKGYQFESLAESLVVGLVRRYLADYRALFRQDSECRDGLTEVLNIFVRAGWPAAIELTYRLEEIFR